MDDATVARRGTDFLLAGTAHEAKAGVRPPLAGACGRRALDRADLEPGRRRRRTRQPGPLGHEPTWWHWRASVRQAPRPVRELAARQT